MARSADVTSWDPIAFDDNASIWASELVFDTLVTSSADGKKVEPSLAESWEVDDAGTTYTFHLRDGVKFTNGDPVTADDVVWSLQRAFDPEAPMAFVSDPSATVAATDDSTVTVTTGKVFAPMLSVLALFSNAIIPKDFGGMTQEEFATTPIGSGPFMVTSWDRGQQAVLSKNPDYWKKGLPYLDSVTLSVVPDDNTRQLQLQGGQAQIDEFPASSSLDTLKTLPGVKVDLFPSSRTWWMTLNNLEAPFDDIHVRKAINHAIDKKAILKAVFYGNGTIANSFLTDASWAHDDSLEGLDYDMKAAADEMAQSSVPDGFATTLLVQSGSSDQAAMAQIVQKSLAEIGIDAEIQNLDNASVNEALDDSNFDMAFTDFTSDIIDPSQMARRADGRPDVSSATYSHWVDPEVGPLLDQAKLTLDQGERTELYTKVQELVNEGAPYVTLFYIPVAYAYSDKLHGFETLPTGNYTLATAWLDE